MSAICIIKTVSIKTKMLETLVNWVLIVVFSIY